MVCACWQVWWVFWPTAQFSLTTPNKVWSSGPPTADQAVRLRNSHRLIENIFENESLQGQPATLEFAETDHISGNNGCNVFHGGVDIDQDSISVGPLAEN